MIHLRDNIYFTTFDHKGVERRRYCIKTVCSSCNKEMYQDRANSLKQKRAACSKECLKALKSGPINPEGIKYKRGFGRGYRLKYLPSHPKAKQNYVAEHRLIVEENLGRYLKDDELVHHIDCNPQNNDLANLDVMSQPEHSTCHGSLESCVPELIKRGHIVYNPYTKKYEVPK